MARRGLSGLGQILREAGGRERRPLQGQQRDVSRIAERGLPVDVTMIEKAVLEMKAGGVSKAAKLDDEGVQDHIM